MATETTPATTSSTVEHTADQVADALNELSLQLATQMDGNEEDLVLAWSDFSSDVRSVVNDLVRRPSRVDIEGMQQRVQALEELLDDSVLELPKAEWELFTSAFQTLIDEVSTEDSA